MNTLTLTAAIGIAQLGALYGLATPHAAAQTVSKVSETSAEDTAKTTPLAHIDTTAFEAATSRAANNTTAPQNQAPRRRTGGHSKGGFIDSYDTNGDGEVDMAEFVAERDAGYARRDNNGDGVVHQEEYVAEYEVRLDEQLEERRERSIDAANFRFTVMDTNDDEVMSIEEFHASSKRMFTRLDTNGDGIVNDEDTAERF